MALPARIFRQGRIPQSYGVALAFYPGDSRFAVAVERAPDLAGAPDLGNISTVGFLSPGELIFLDTSIGSDSATFHYRGKHVRAGYNDGADLAFMAAKSGLIPDTLPLIPPEDVTSLDVDVVEATGEVTFSVNTSPRFKSMKFVKGTVGFGDPSTGTVVALDADGDALVNPSLTLTRGQTAFIAVALYGQPGGVGAVLGTLRATGRYGEAGDPGLTGLDVAIVEATGAVTFTVNLPPEFKSIRHVQSTVGFGSPFAGTIRNLDADGDVIVNPGVTLTRGQTIFVSVAAYKLINAGGPDFGMIRATGRYTVGAEIPTLEVTTEDEAGAVGTFGVTVHDPDGLMDDLFVKKKVGAAAWTTFALVTNSPTDGVQSTETVVLEEGNHKSFIHFRGRYTLNGMQTEIDKASSAFDRGTIPDFVMSAVVDKDFKASVEASGDKDFVSAKIAFTKGTNPTAPTDAAVRARTAVNGRKLLPSGVNAAYGDIPVQLAENEKAIFKAFGYSGTGGTGEESTEPEVAEISRPGVPAGAAPGLPSVSTDEVDDDGSFLQWDLSFSTTGVDSTTHEILVRYFTDDLEDPGAQSIIEIDVPQPFQKTTDIPIGGSGGKLFNNTLLLRLKETGDGLAFKATTKVSAI